MDSSDLEKFENETSELCEKIKGIIKEELEIRRIEYDFVSAEIPLSTKRVGIKGDRRTEEYPVFIRVVNNGDVVFNQEFMERASTRITNETRLNTVLYDTV